ncbi:hypothetical protein [Roseospirillum parvum]|uniref:Uncharacterized protein n=1 Tax=Roseospirillum parvum TaxID=83401 RepID=A0A1G7UX42_9PROT|nr:hypothetical protein [Roseospirillum parvum]SDG51709.1 hypothetical protein SAMN05421742_101451 [Roseospirillum parvum]
MKGFSVDELANRQRLANFWRGVIAAGPSLEQTAEAMRQNRAYAADDDGQATREADNHLAGLIEQHVGPDGGFDREAFKAALSPDPAIPEALRQGINDLDRQAFTDFTIGQITELGIGQVLTRLGMKEGVVKGVVGKAPALFLFD